MSELDYAKVIQRTTDGEVALAVIQQHGGVLLAKRTKKATTSGASRSSAARGLLGLPAPPLADDNIAGCKKESAANASSPG